MMESADRGKHGHTRITNSEFIGFIYLIYLIYSFVMSRKVAHCYSNYFLVLTIMSESVNYFTNLDVVQYISWHCRYRSCLNANVRIVALVQTIQTMSYIFYCIAIQHKSLNNLQYYLKFYHSNQISHLQTVCSFGSLEVLKTILNFLEFRHSLKPNLYCSTK